MTTHCPHGIAIDRRGLVCSKCLKEAQDMTNVAAWCEHGVKPEHCYYCSGAAAVDYNEGRDPHFEVDVELTEMCKLVDTKPTNPKDAIGSTKLDLGLVPDTLTVYAALAFTEGALKYGRYNWRLAGVRASIYHAALKRHLAKWWNGEWADPATGVPHLASVLACAGILVDAHEMSKLEDDRPPASAGPGNMIDGGTYIVGVLKEQFKDHAPHQYTINDSEVKS